MSPAELADELIAELATVESVPELTALVANHFRRVLAERYEAEATVIAGRYLTYEVARAIATERAEHIEAELAAAAEIARLRSESFDTAARLQAEIVELRAEVARSDSERCKALRADYAGRMREAYADVRVKEARLPVIAAWPTWKEESDKHRARADKAIKERDASAKRLAEAEQLVAALTMELRRRIS